MATNETARVARRERAALLRGIYVIVNEGERDPIAIARASLNAGVRVVQYRAKRGIDARRLNMLRALTRERDALLIVNDDWQAAIEFDCDGVHLGPDDDGFTHIGPIREALGERLIGLSCGTAAEAASADSQGADYIGVGSVYATGSKADAGAPIGIGGLQRVIAATTLPAAAIGGIDEAHVAEVRRTGVAMAAVISAIANAPDPGAAASRLVRMWNEG